jgi:hypothetical protein
VVAVIGVDKREDRAGVGDDHGLLPIPLSSSSARSDRSPFPLLAAPKQDGRVCPVKGSHPGRPDNPGWKRPGSPPETASALGIGL